LAAWGAFGKRLPSRHVHSFDEPDSVHLLRVSLLSAMDDQPPARVVGLATPGPRVTIIDASERQAMLRRLAWEDTLCNGVGHLLHWGSYSISAGLFVLAISTVKPGRDEWTTLGKAYLACSFFSWLFFRYLFVAEIGPYDWLRDWRIRINWMRRSLEPHPLQLHRRELAGKN
jgi:hypothetical protein